MVTTPSWTRPARSTSSTVPFIMDASTEQSRSHGPRLSQPQQPSRARSIISTDSAEKKSCQRRCPSTSSRE